ncbi:MAG TPA: tRNA (guanosine(37)-N1)-methyltransferase TrmD [Streptosporangiaceae bacterium]|nr:tRNA (guanosine(37)-N1)-methyltransferase TrmD [Streptosporangiaceae bacterium]
MRIDIITIFPEYFGGFRGVAPPGQPSGPLGVSLIGKAAARGDIEFGVHDLRQWAHDIHRTVDDTPFGGGPGMVMKPEPWAEALDEVAPPGRLGPAPRLVVPTPSGVPFSQAGAASYAVCPWLVFACGRYEGIDARFIDYARSRMPVDEVSIGDYVLAGGEAAVLVMVEAVCRLLPGVLGNERSASDDSFGGDTAEAAGMAGLLEGPVYTRPRSWRGRDVPDILLSGDHAAIARWRRDAALLRTAANRPDLIERAVADPAGGLDARDRQVLSCAAEGCAEDAVRPGDQARLPACPENMAH